MRSLNNYLEKSYRKAMTNDFSQIIYVIGPPFTGKTTYIQSQFQNKAYFDIQSFYKTLGPSKTREFFTFPLESRVFILEDYILSSFSPPLSLLIVESSGLNQALNQWLIKTNVSTLTILVWTPFNQVRHRIFQVARQHGINPQDSLSMKKCFGFDPLALLKIWEDAYNRGEISFNTRYLPGLNLYVPFIDLRNMVE